MAVIYAKEQDGLDRVAGDFYDGQNIRHVLCVNKQLAVFKQNGDKVANLDRVDNDYVVRSISCRRSRQTGNLVVTLGGFRLGSGSKQQVATVTTDYAVAPNPAGEDE